MLKQVQLVLATLFFMVAIMTMPAFGQTELVQNGGFEIGTGSISQNSPPWRFNGEYGIVYHDDSFLAHSGKGVAVLGGHTTAVASCAQTITFPTAFTNLQLTLYLKILDDSKANGADKLFVGLYNSNGSLNTGLTSYSDLDNGKFFPYGKVTLDVSRFAGQTLQLGMVSVNGDLSESTFFVDDVSIIASNAPKPDFNISITPSTQSISAGQTANFSLISNRLNGFDQTINVTFSGLPPSSTVPAFSSPSPTPFQVVTDQTTPANTYTVTVTGTGGGLTRTASFILVVNPAGPILNVALFDGRKTLTLAGSKFGISPKVLINGFDHTALIKNKNDGFILLKAKPTKLSIQRGTNSVVVVDSSGNTSNTTTFQFLE